MYATGNELICVFLKHLGLALLWMKVRGSLHVPEALQQLRRVTLSLARLKLLACFSP